LSQCYPPFLALKSCPTFTTEVISSEDPSSVLKIIGFSIASHQNANHVLISRFIMSVRLITKTVFRSQLHREINHPRREQRGTNLRVPWSESQQAMGDATRNDSSRLAFRDSRVALGNLAPRTLTDPTVPPAHTLSMQFAPFGHSFFYELENQKSNKNERCDHKSKCDGRSQKNREPPVRHCNGLTERPLQKRR